jgi:hypothetical protein
MTYWLSGSANAEPGECMVESKANQAHPLGLAAQLCQASLESEAGHAHERRINGEDGRSHTWDVLYPFIKPFQRNLVNYYEMKSFYFIV